MKKGMVSPIFKYIFVLVAGTLILFFFIRFAFLQKGSSESLGDVLAITNLNDNLEAFAISPNADTTIDMGTSVDLKFNRAGICGTIAVGDARPLRSNKIIFGPEEMSTRRIDAWTQTWIFPFKIGNFYYLNDEVGC
jgi:hypothetical protein